MIVSLVCSHTSSMIQQGGAIHQPYFVITGVEAQLSKVRTYMDGSTFLFV